jgi:hypothetical protein
MTEITAPSSATTGLTCMQVIDLLADYLESTLGPAVVEALRRHLDDCAPCVAYLNTYRRTRDVTAAVERAPMPEDLRARLREFLLDRLRHDGA